jgi:hypothetical protein
MGIQTDGVADAWSSIGSINTFNNFTFEAWMMRKHATVDNLASGLVLRGTTEYDSKNQPLDMYSFLVAPNHTYSIWKHVNGTAIPIKPWTSRSDIDDDYWLRVVMDNSNIRFYIDNHLVWEGKDATFKTGQVGIQMYQSADALGLGNDFKIDSARLSMSIYYKAGEQVAAGQEELLPNGDEPMVPEHTP